jgi:glycosyltransferase involved in cell wall biosynthesis
MRWKHYIAESLATAGALRGYVTTIASTPRYADSVTRFLPERVGRIVRKYLKLQELPEDVPESSLDRVAVPSAVVKALTIRAGVSPRVQASVVAGCDVWFDRAASRRIRQGDGVVVVAAGSSLQTMRRARRLGVTTVLDYPTAHVGYGLDIAREEHRLQPAFAPTLPLVYFNEKRHAHLEREIAEADRIVLLSSFAKRTFVERGIDEDRLLLTHHGVDVEMFRPADEEERAERDGGPFRVLFAGQLTQLKGISYAIEGFDRAALPESELRFVGQPRGTDAPWRDHPRLVHQPPVPIFELRRQYVTSHVYVLPSLFEGFPHTAIIAMACGLPCILSENTFGSDVITDGVDGFVVPIRDPDAIAERITRLHDDPELRERMGRAARERALQFTWDAYRARMGSILGELAG